MRYGMDEMREENARTRIMPVSNSTYTFSVSIRSVSGLAFLALPSGEGEVGVCGSAPELRSRIVSETVRICEMPHEARGSRGMGCVNHVRHLPVSDVASEALTSMAANGL